MCGWLLVECLGNANDPRWSWGMPFTGLSSPKTAGNPLSGGPLASCEAQFRMLWIALAWALLLCSSGPPSLLVRSISLPAFECRHPGRTPHAALGQRWLDWLFPDPPILIILEFLPCKSLPFEIYLLGIGSRQRASGNIILCFCHFPFPSLFPYTTVKNCNLPENEAVPGHPC